MIGNRESGRGWILIARNNFLNQDDFFISFFEKLAGTADLRKQILAGKTEEEIKASWQEDLEAFKAIRKKYLLYKDFE